jgi:hypothetical protein
MMAHTKILPGTGRGTMPVLSDAAGGVEGRSMVEGARVLRCAMRTTPSVSRCAAATSPQVGRI